MYFQGVTSNTIVPYQIQTFLRCSLHAFEILVFVYQRVHCHQMTLQCIPVVHQHNMAVLCAMLWALLLSMVVTTKQHFLVQLVIFKSSTFNFYNSWPSSILEVMYSYLIKTRACCIRKFSGWWFVIQLAAIDNKIML